MAERQELERLFVDNLPAIDRMLGAVCRRHGIAADDASDFASWARLRLIESDYAIISKFRGESAFTTYLTVVVAMLFRDYCVQRWGRWRPSAEARRRGPLAMRIEALVHRQGLRLNEVAQVLRTAGAPSVSERELANMVRTLPQRAPLRPVEVGAEPLTEAESADRADSQISDEIVEREHQAATTLLDQAMQALAPEDRLALRLRFWEEMSIADIARTLGVPQKPLYRRVERALLQLRVELERLGMTKEQVRELLEGIAP
jgi:RNA polymerase sigma factor for flagellar operon FliA